MDLLGSGGSTTRFSLPVDLRILESKWREREREGRRESEGGRERVREERGRERGREGGREGERGGGEEGRERSDCNLYFIAEMTPSDYLCSYCVIW